MRRPIARRGFGKPETFAFLGFTFICGKWGNRVTAPHPKAQKCGNFHILASGITELPPVRHAPKPEPVATPRATAQPATSPFFDPEPAGVVAARRRAHLAARDNIDRKAAHKAEFTHMLQQAERDAWVNELGYA
jgi:hypothetical protein